MPMEPRDHQRLCAPIADGGLGYTGAVHLKDAADVASLRQCTPQFLQQLQHDTPQSLLEVCPKTKTHLIHLVSNIDPALWGPILQSKTH